jgi:hypothetical protein
MDVLSIAVLAIIIILALSANMPWLAGLAILLLLFYFWGAKKEEEGVSVPTGAPKIRPIIVQREYTGPSSIYPPSMRVRINPSWFYVNPWEGAAIAAGWAARGLTRMFASGGKGGPATYDPAYKM